MSLNPRIHDWLRSCVAERRPVLVQKVHQFFANKSSTWQLESFSIMKCYVLGSQQKIFPSINITMLPEYKNIETWTQIIFCLIKERFQTLKTSFPKSRYIFETFRCMGKVLKKERYFVSEILTFIFDMERVPLQPANSFLQPAKTGRI